MSKQFQPLHKYEALLQQAPKVWVGFSGGLDSTVLLHQARQLKLRCLNAVYIDHQLSSSAKSWGEHCRQFAQAQGVPFHCELVDLKRAGKGVEAAAREARYAAFIKKLQPGDVLLTAHHAGDQAETLLFRLMRGAGLKGLAGVPEQRCLPLAGGGAAQLLRPLLSVSRGELLNYALQQGLEWVEDESNHETRFDRNYLRNKVLPLLAERWPVAVSQIARSAGLLQQNQLLLDEYAEQDLERCGAQSERVGQSLDLAALQQFTLQRQAHVLRYWVDQHSYSLPSQQHFKEINKLMAAAEDAVPEVSWGQCSLYRFNQRIFLLPRLAAANSASIGWKTGATAALGDGFTLSSAPSASGLAPGEYTLRFRSGGERCKPEQRSKSQTLKKLLQEARVEPWLRDRIPLIYSGNDLVAVGDLWVCSDYVQQGGHRPLWCFGGADSD